MPTKADISKLDNPARAKANHQSLELNHVDSETTGYLKPWERQFASHNASEGVEPRNNHRCT